MDESLTLYDVKEVAGILKTSCQQVRKMIASKELKSIKVGREYRISRKSLNEYINKGEN